MTGACLTHTQDTHIEKAGDRKCACAKKQWSAWCNNHMYVVQGSAVSASLTFSLPEHHQVAAVRAPEHRAPCSALATLPGTALRRHC